MRAAIDEARTRIKDHVRHTPLEYSPGLSKDNGGPQVFIKMGESQPSDTVSLLVLVGSRAYMQGCPFVALSHIGEDVM